MDGNKIVHDWHPMTSSKAEVQVEWCSRTKAVRVRRDDGDWYITTPDQKISSFLAKDKGISLLRKNEAKSDTGGIKKHVDETYRFLS